jgi:hypothetical protein
MTGDGSKPGLQQKLFTLDRNKRFRACDVLLLSSAGQLAILEE